MFPQARAMLGKAIAAGVKIACGTDAPAIPHGENAKELWAMVDRGMTPMQALRAATVMSAELIDVDDRGRLAPGLPRRHHRGARRPVRGHHDDPGRALRDEGRPRLQRRLTDRAQRVAVVTGGASGMGRSICEQFAARAPRRGARHRRGRLPTPSPTTSRSRGAQALACPVDVADRASVDDAIGAVRSEFGPVEILVTSAGISMFEPFLEITLESWNRIIEVNLTGTFHCVQATIPDMVAAEWGRIVTISSSSAQRARRAWRTTRRRRAA